MSVLTFLANRRVGFPPKQCSATPAGRPTLSLDSAAVCLATASDPIVEASVHEPAPTSMTIRSHRSPGSHILPDLAAHQGSRDPSPWIRLLARAARGSQGDADVWLPVYCGT